MKRGGEIGKKTYISERIEGQTEDERKKREIRDKLKEKGECNKSKEIKKKNLKISERRKGTL